MQNFRGILCALTLGLAKFDACFKKLGYDGQ